jgi:hypothetical protein
MDGADGVRMVLVLVDDARFGNASTFGGPCQTPTTTRLAGQGLRRLSSMSCRKTPAGQEHVQQEKLIRS